MEKLSKISIPIIKYSCLEKLSKLLTLKSYRNDNSNMPVVGIWPNTNTTRKEYNVLGVYCNTKKEAINFLNDILNKSVEDRIVLDNNSFNIHLTNEELLYLYNKYTIKDKEKYKTSIESLYYKDSKRKFDRYVVDTPPCLNSYCKEIKNNLKKLIKSNIPLSIYIGVEDKKQDASIYLLYPRNAHVDVYIERVKQSLNLKDNLEKYYLDSDTVVYQFSMTLDYLKSIYTYLKMIN